MSDKNEYGEFLKDKRALEKSLDNFHKSGGPDLTIEVNWWRLRGFVEYVNRVLIQDSGQMVKIYEEIKKLNKVRS